MFVLEMIGLLVIFGIFAGIGGLITWLYVLKKDREETIRIARKRAEEIDEMFRDYGRSFYTNYGRDES